MQSFYLKSKTETVQVLSVGGHTNVMVYETHQAISDNIRLDDCHYEKLSKYKSVSALLKYAKHHALPSPNTATDLPSEPVAVEGNPHSPVQSCNHVLAGETSPVALAPTIGDTPFQEMPLDNSLVFKLWSHDFCVTLRHDYSTDYIAIIKTINLLPVFEIKLLYSEKKLGLLLTARNPQTLFMLAQELERKRVAKALEAVA